jgi:hypothetical protein
VKPDSSSRRATVKRFTVVVAGVAVGIAGWWAYSQYRVAPAVTGSAGTIIRVRNNLAGDQVALVLRRNGDPACNDDRLFIGIQSFAVGASFACASEMYAFAEDHRIQIESMRKSTTPAIDIVAVPHPLPVVLWLDPAFKSEEVALRKELERADQLFNSMSCGVRVVPEVRRFTSSGGPFPPIKCSTDFRGLTAVGLFDESRLNIYVVSDSDRHGQFCGVDGSSSLAKQAILIGPLRYPETIAHEIGHALSLQDGEVINARHNLMHQDSPERRAVTLGQCFAANVDKGSALTTWKPNGLKPRDCSAVSACPDRTCIGCFTVASRPPSMLTDDVADRWLGGEESEFDGRTENEVVALGDAVVSRLGYRLAHGIPEPVESVRRQFAQGFREMSAYEVNHPEVAVPGYTEQQYVEDHVQMYQDSLEIRGAHALGRIAKARHPRATDALRAALNFRLSDVVRAAVRAALEFAQQ